MRGTLTKDRVMQHTRTIAEDTLGKVLIRSSNDGGVTFGQPVALADSKHVGAVMEFGVNVLLLPFGSDGLIALKTRNIHRQPQRRSGTSSDTDESSIEESHDSEVIMWVSSNGGRNFGESITASSDARNSGLSWGSTIVQETNASTGEQLSSLFLVYEAGTFLGNKDIYFRKITL